MRPEVVLEFVSLLYLIILNGHIIELSSAAQTTMMGEHLSPKDFESGASVAITAGSDDDLNSADEMEDILPPKYDTRSSGTKPWPNGIVPYLIDSSFTEDERAVIARSVTMFREATCVRIIARTTEPDYLVILKVRGGSCSSHVGYQGGKQSSSLARRCVLSPGSTIHELMHVLGFFHEQNRPDRDEYVTIYFENIARGAIRNFVKTDTPGNMESPYDTLSITHYGSRAFSVNRRATMLPKNGTNPLGQRMNLTKYDIQKIVGFYKCNAQAPTSINLVPGLQNGTTTLPNNPTMSKNSSEFANGTTELIIPEARTQQLLTCAESDPTNCRKWARVGHCAESPIFMSVFCKDSCKECDKPCRDMNPSCEIWAKKKYCPKYADYMQFYCPKSCNTCPL